jgi:exopolysaccharide biosynthesis protein
VVLPGPLLAGLLLLGPQSPTAEPVRPTPASETTREQTLAPGLVHLEIRRLAPDGDAGRWVIQVLRLDPSRVRLAVAPALDALLGAETTSSLARRHGALAAVNGGYFRTSGLYRGEPAGALALGGRLLSEPDRRRPVLALGTSTEATRVGFTRLQVEPSLVVDGTARLRVQGFNRPRGGDEIVVYTPEFHRTTLTGSGGFEAAVSEETVVSTREEQGSSPIPHDGFVVSASGTAARETARLLRQGVPVRVDAPLRTDPVLGFAADTFLGGGPWLLRQGAPAPLADGEPYAEGFRALRHPRTAIGVRGDGTILLVIVDGRQPGWSDGMTIEELTALMKELGCGEALNLDGGGSTTMIVRDRVVNRPSDAAGERPVSDAVLVFAR